MSTFIQITEVGPRDGFQNIKTFIPTDLKIKIIDRLVEAGIGAMEITSMVSPKAIPQMRDAREVIQHVLTTHPHIIPSVLVPNVKVPASLMRQVLKILTMSFRSVRRITRPTLTGPMPNRWRIFITFAIPLRI